MAVEGGAALVGTAVGMGVGAADASVGGAEVGVAAGGAGAEHATNIASARHDTNRMGGEIRLQVTRP